MTYKTILTYWDSETFSEARVESAAAFAERLDAHLDVVAFGYEPDIPPYAFGGTSAAAMADFYGQAKAEAEGLAQKASAVIERMGARGEAEPVVSTYSGLPMAMGSRARFADLVIASQPYETTFEHAAVNVLEGALFEGEAPTLVLPLKPAAVSPETVVIGWNGSREALRAVKGAMPVLTRAKSVEIAILEPSSEEETPGEDVALMLSRHGVHAEVVLLPRTGDSLSAAMRQHLRERGADLLVMGAYSHSRIRQFVLGGMTRDLLGDVPLPILMAH